MSYKSEHSQTWKASYFRLFTLFITLMLITSVLFPLASSVRDNQTWFISLNISEPGGGTDTVIFSEAPDANDGMPNDNYDLPKPIPPMPPYIRSWFDDGLSLPFNLLWEDCRQYPDNSKTWNLSIQWYPEDFVSTTTITISWNTSALLNTEYNTIHLYQSGTFATDMLIQSSYSYNAPALTPTPFTIMCTIINNQPPFALNDVESTPEDTSCDINVSENDYDLDGGLDLNSINITLFPTYGTTFIQPNNGIVTYIPSSGYSGQDTFIYTLPAEYYAIVWLHS